MPGELCNSRHFFLNLFAVQEKDFGLYILKLYQTNQYKHSPKTTTL